MAVKVAWGRPATCSGGHKRHGESLVHVFYLLCSEEFAEEGVSVPDRGGEGWVWVCELVHGKAASVFSFVCRSVLRNGTVLGSCFVGLNWLWEFEEVMSLGGVSAKFSTCWSG